MPLPSVCSYIITVTAVDEKIRICEIIARTPSRKKKKRFCFHARSLKKFDKTKVEMCYLVYSCLHACEKSCNFGQFTKLINIIIILMCEDHLANFSPVYCTNPSYAKLASCYNLTVYSTRNKTCFYFCGLNDSQIMFNQYSTSCQFNTLPSLASEKSLGIWTFFPPNHDLYPAWSYLKSDL